jgi:hypothetical protein
MDPCSLILAPAALRGDSGKEAGNDSPLRREDPRPAGRYCLLDGGGASEQVSLGECDAEFPECVGGLVVFDPFGDGLLSEAFS